MRRRPVRGLSRTRGACRGLVNGRLATVLSLSRRDGIALPTRYMLSRRAPRRFMAAKLSEGDTIAMQGEVTHVHDDGTVTVRLYGLNYPVTTTGEHLSLVAKRQPAGRKKPLYDEAD